MMDKEKNILDIVFGQSEAGSLKFAASPPKKGKSPTAVFVINSDGSPATEEQLTQVRAQAEEASRKVRDSTLHLEIDRNNIVCLSFGLAMGDISEDIPGEKRLAEMKTAFAHLPGKRYKNVADEIFENSVAGLNRVLAHMSAGNPIRIWCSNNPFDLCGLYWLMYLINKLENHGDIYTVFLPDMVHREDGTIIRYTGWGELSPHEWQLYFKPEKATPAFITMCAGEWHRLKADNAPVRGVLNGVLHSLPEDIYDSFILKEIKAMDTEFMQARVVGNVLGKYRLAINDGWIAQRMEKMIGQGIIEPISAPPEDGPIYHRMMKKNI